MERKAQAPAAVEGSAAVVLPAEAAGIGRRCARNCSEAARHENFSG